MVNDADPSMASPVDGVFLEVVENELLVGAEDWDPTGDPSQSERLTLRIEFADEDGKTRLTIRQGPYTEEIMGQAREGWGSSFTKLDALLAS